MIILLALIIGIIIGYILKGRLKNLALSIKVPILVILSIIPEIFTGYLSDKLPSLFPRYLWLLILVEYILLFAFIICNLRNKYMYIVAFGVLLNFAVIMANGGRMPVSQAIYSIPSLERTIERILAGDVPEYFIMEKKVTLWYLGDIIPVPIWGAGLGSVGDIFIMAGVSLFTISSMRKKIAKHDKLQDLKG